MQPSVLPKEYFYCLDGAKVEGPHTGRELAELLSEGTLTHEALVIATGEQEWKALGQHPDISVIVIVQKAPEESQSVGKTVGAQTLTAEEREEIEELTKTRRRTRHGMLLCENLRSF